MESEKKAKVPEPEMTTEGKYRCKIDKQEYDNRDDYETHCFEEHSSEM